MKKFVKASEQSEYDLAKKHYESAKREYEQKGEADNNDVLTREEKMLIARGKMKEAKEALDKVVSSEDEEYFDEEMSQSELEDRLDKIVHDTKVNGPQYRGARMPKPLPQCINEASIPDNMRFKSYEFSVLTDRDVDCRWITQDPFDSKDAEQLAQEIRRALKYNLDKNNYPKFYKGKMVLQLEVICRDGRDEGYMFNEYDLN